MPNDNVKDMVNSLAGGDNIKAQDAFKNALSDKIGQALDDKRQTVANDWLNSAQELEAVADAAGLDKLGLEADTSAEEPVEIDNDEEENEQPIVPEV